MTNSNKSLEFRDINKKLRSQYLKCNQQIAKALAAKDSEAETKAREERARVSNEFFERNHKLAYKFVADLGTAPSNADDVTQAAFTALWEAFAGKTPAERDGVIENPDGTLTPTGGWNPQTATFGTWARAFIRGAATRELHRNSRQAAIPYGDWSLRPRVEEGRAALTKKLGRSPSTTELAAHLDLRKQVVENASFRAISLETPIGEDGNTVLGDRLVAPSLAAEEPRTPLPENISLDPGAELAQVANELSTQELCVKLLTDGLVTETPRSGVQTGSLLGLNRGVVANDVKRISDKLTPKK